MRYERRKCRIAAEAKDVFNMETSTKQIDKAYELLNESVRILRKFQAAMAVNKIKPKVNDGTGIDIDALIDQADKVADKVLTYSIKLSVIKESK